MAVSSGRSHHLPAASFTVSIGRALLACSSFPYLSTTSTAARLDLTCLQDLDTAAGIRPL
jgi:hypothetical protein